MQKSFRHRIEALETAAEVEPVANDQALDETDAAALDDEELLSEAFWGLLDCELAKGPLSFASGTLKVARYWHPQGCAEERYWTFVAARAGALCAAAQLVIFPLVREDAIAALALVDAGLMKARPLYANCWKSHHTTLGLPYNGGVVSEAFKLLGRLAYALDQVQAQTGAPFITDVAELRADLVAAIGETDCLPIFEPA